MPKNFSKIFIIIAMFAAGILMPLVSGGGRTAAASCADVKLVFARGSGGTRWEDSNYQEFKRWMTDKLALTHLSYEFEDLDYPAIGIGDPRILLSTFIGGGEAYEFGESVHAGVANLVDEINDLSCPDTKYVIGGYSQGAMVISKAVQYLNPEKVIYAATFGDPKLYLPEGKGFIPPACRNQNLSNYRIYVPDCYAYSGVLGGYNPYQPEGFTDKLGTWCNKADFFCSSHVNIKDHLSYISDGVYKEASKEIYAKIAAAFGIENKYVSPHDTVILIDGTGSMNDYIRDYKTEAQNLANQTLANGGRVALYTYGDLAEGEALRELCNFDTCTTDTFRRGLKSIWTGGGGDPEESLLSASYRIMKKLEWNYGSTKSVVVLTDAGYHNPDLDETTFEEVVMLSKEIDPVNFYIITPERTMDLYTELAAATDGAVVSSASNLRLLTEQIISRYDSLPRVEESSLPVVLPVVSDVEWEVVALDRVRLSWANTGAQTVVALNDMILGMTELNEIVLEELDLTRENIVTLAPLTDDRRGESVRVVVSEGSGYGAMDGAAKSVGGIIIPAAPNTGQR